MPILPTYRIELILKNDKNQKLLLDNLDLKTSEANVKINRVVVLLAEQVLSQFTGTRNIFSTYLDV